MDKQLANNTYAVCNGWWWYIRRSPHGIWSFTRHSSGPPSVLAIYKWLGPGVKLFADDCILPRQINTETDCLTFQQDLDTVVQWSEKWQMSFNPQKCSVLTVTKKKKIIFHHYKMCGVELAHVNQQAYLGLEFASDLRWGPHIQKITSKASRDLNIIRRNIPNAPQVIKEQAYKTFIRQSVEYAHSMGSISTKPYKPGREDTEEGCEVCH